MATSNRPGENLERTCSPHTTSWIRMVIHLNCNKFQSERQQGTSVSW